MDFLCNFKIKIDSQNLDHGYIKDQWFYPNHDQDAKPKSGTQASPKTPNKDMKDMDVLCTFTMKIKTQNLEHEYFIA